MFISFQKLCEYLNLTSSYKKQEQLVRLDDWCTSHISQDVSYTGTESERYKNYLSFAKNYLDHFLKEVTEEFLLQTNFEGMNAIQYAAFKGYNHFLALIAQSHFHLLNEGNQAGMTALHLGALKGHIHSVKTLLEAKVLPNNANADREFPIHSALILTIDNEELKKRKIELFHLLKQAAPYTINAVTINGDTVAHLMAKNGFVSLLADLIKEQSPLLFIKNNHGKYPIHIAILNRQLKAVQTLMTVPNMGTLCDAEKRTPLHYAAVYGDADMIKTCIGDGSYLNARDSYEKTPVMSAKRSGNFAAVKLLVELGADEQTTDEEDFAILDYQPFGKLDIM